MLNKYAFISSSIGILIASQAALAETFGVVAIPDSQYYAAYDPVTHLNIDAGQTSWIAQNAAAKNIKFVVHLGDIVDDALSTYQWNVAKNAMTSLDNANIPYGVCLGNHDELHNGSPSSGNVATAADLHPENWLANFGPSNFQSKSWFSGASPSGCSSFQIIPAGGKNLLFMELRVDMPQSEINWAQSIMNANPDKPVILSTHRYLEDYRLPQYSGRYNNLQFGAFEQQYDPNAQTAESVFQNFIKTNTNIAMVLCGHCDGELHQASYNANGKPVYEILADYQNFSPYGGGGNLRELQFDTDANTVHVRTFSTLTGQYRSNDEGFQQTLASVPQYEDALIDALGVSHDVGDYMIHQLIDNNGAGLYAAAYASGDRASDFTISLNLNDYVSVPEPATLSLLFLIAPMLLARRRYHAIQKAND